MFPGKWVAMRERGEGRRKGKVDEIEEGRNGKVER